MSLISVIIPVYKVEEYLTACVDSVLGQTLTDIRVILVDDGSPDRCPALCDDYAKRDSRVTVVHKPNGGLSDARNAGLPFADGDFVFYLDSDDLLEPDALETLLDLQIKTGADVVIGSYLYTFPDHEIKAESGISGCAVMDGGQALEALVTGKIQNFAWGKLIRREIASSRLFPKGKRFEDVYWMHWVLHDASVVCVTDRALVHYRQRDNSISYEYNLNRLDIVDGWRARKAYLDEYRPDLTDRFLAATAESFTAISWLVLTKMKHRKREAFALMRRFSREVGLASHTEGQTADLIAHLDKSDLSYTARALFLKLKNKIGGKHRYESMGNH